jgi:disulfide bond formation protein DsbB
MGSISYWLDRSSLYIALLAAWIAMLGSLYFSEVMGFVPCDLCWYQRILMYPLTIILAAGLLLRDRHLPKIVLPLSSLGVLIALYHYLLEKTDWFDAIQVCRNGVACTTLWINWLGFITIPFLSLTAFTIITLMCIVAISAGEPDESDEAVPAHPFLPVAAVVGAVLIVFGVLFTNGWQRTSDARAIAAKLELPGTVAIQAGPHAEGHALFVQACGACHGANAEGVTSLGNTLVANEFVQGLDDTELLQFIRTGRDLNSPENTSGLVMPPSGGRPDLDDTQMQAIITYVRSVQ